MISFLGNRFWKEIISAKHDYHSSVENVSEKRSILRNDLNENLIPSIILHTRQERRISREHQESIHEKKLVTLSREQDRPLLNVSSTVITLGLCTDLPNYVRETLSLGPKSAVLDKVNPKNILTELDLLLDFCKRHE